MKVTAEREFDHAFVVIADDIKLVWAVLSEDIGTVTFEADCVDGIKRQFDSYEVLIEYQNASGKAFKSIDITARDEDGRASATLRLGTEYRYLANIALIVRAEEELAQKTRSRISEIIVELKPWYSPFRKANHIYVGLVIYVLLLNTSFIYTKDLAVEALKSMTSSGVSRELLVVIFVFILSVFLALLYLLLWGLGKLVARFFPKSAFAIGRGLERYNFDERIRWGIFGVPLSLFTAFAVNFIRSLF
ncbi:MAG: hypothetical protein EXR08_01255 [Alphaproteobacteria bacterium]|nr:hypothetical protein [Alphaproteobacteria bacterium]